MTKFKKIKNLLRSYDRKLPENDEKGGLCGVNIQIQGKILLPCIPDVECARRHVILKKNVNFKSLTLRLPHLFRQQTLPFFWSVLIRL